MHCLWGHKKENYEFWLGSDRKLYIWELKDDARCFRREKRSIFQGKEITSSVAEVWMPWSDLYWVGQIVHLSFSLWCLVREQEVFPEYILIKNNISKRGRKQNLNFSLWNTNKHSSSYVIIVMFGELYIVYSCIFIVFKKVL